MSPPYGGPGTLLHGVSWETYERLRAETDAAGQVLYITYDHGRMLLMAPLFDHEVWKSLIGRMVQVMAMELRIPLRSGGSTTLKREDLEKGVEADECFYVQNEAAVRATRRLNRPQDPPPDLAIEIERTHAPMDKPSVYAALGVNEIWTYNGRRLTAHVLDRTAAEPAYRPAEHSAAFPFLRPADLEPFIARAYEVDDTTLLIEFRDWVTANLKKQ